MSQNKPPLFRGTTVDNSCAKCGTNTTGCWRRGWVVDGESVNLCNKCKTPLSTESIMNDRCGLQYKSGKWDSTGSRPLSLEPPKGHSSPSSSDSLQEQGDETRRFTGYSMERQSGEGTSRKVLFYVHDAEGQEQLALIGHDPKGTGHFNYESVEGFEPSLKCKNRALVLTWLGDMGASQAIERSMDMKSLTPLKQANRVPPRPSFAKEYCDYREDSGRDGDIEFENFYLVNAEGTSKLAVNGSTHGDCSQYRCILVDHEFTFDDRSEAIGWLEWVVGRTEFPPYRFLKKEPRKPMRLRDAYVSSLQERGPTKRKLSTMMLEDMQAVFEDDDLMMWVLRKPSKEEIETFDQLRSKLTAASGILDSPADEQDNTQELLEVLRQIQQSKTCLKLLEVTSLGRPVSALKRCGNEAVVELASVITKTWSDLTTKALEKAADARKKSCTGDKTAL